METPDDPLPEDPPAKAKAWFHDREGWRYRLINTLSKMTSGRLMAPFYHSTVAFHQKREFEELAKHRIDDDEHVAVWCIWSAEFYTPNSIANLYDGLERLQASGFSEAREHPTDWVRALRATGGGSFELYLAPKGKKVWGSGHYIDLPNFAERAGASILSLTPSLTVLVTCFLFKEPMRALLDVELHQEHPTEIRPNPGGSLSIVSPDLRHREIVRQSREERARLVTAWHREHFPGLSSGDDKLVPTCEFNVVRGAKPLATENGHSRLLSALGLEWSPDVFESDYGSLTKPLRFREGSDLFGPREMSILSIAHEEMVLLDDEGFGSSDEGRIWAIDAEFRRTFAISSLTSILHHYREHVARARDGASEVVGRGSADQALTKVRADTAALFDASTVARDLKDAAASQAFSMYGMDLQLRGGADESPKPTLINLTSQFIERESQRLILDIGELNNALNTQANLLSAQANLKLQPLIIALAILSLFASIVAAIQPARELIFKKGSENMSHSTVPPVNSRTSPRQSPASAPRVAPAR
jgi:hypothetical protein